MAARHYAKWNTNTNAFWPRNPSPPKPTTFAVPSPPPSPPPSYILLFVNLIAAQSLIRIMLL